MGLEKPLLGESPKSKFGIDSEELMGRLTQIHKNFNRRNLHTPGKQLLLAVAGWEKMHTPQDRILFIGGYNVKPYGGKWCRPPERTIHS